MLLKHLLWEASSRDWHWHDMDFKSWWACWSIKFNYRVLFTYLLTYVRFARLPYAHTRCK